MTRLDTGMEARVRTRALPGTVALTFDDGPDPVWTARVLAELARLRATATFFVDTHRARAHPELIEAMPRAATRSASTASTTSATRS